MIGKLLNNLRPAATNPGLPQEPAGIAPPAVAMETATPPAAGGHEQSTQASVASIMDTELRRARLWMQAQQLERTLLADHRYDDPRRLERHGWKAYSQNDEDGLIDEIFRRIGVRHKSFVDFGCGDGLENNSVYLLAQGWRGLWIDGSRENLEMIRLGFAPLIERQWLQVCEAFIDRDNIDGLIAAANLGPEIDFLSIDVDGNDYYVWEAVKCVKPRVVAIEYNGKFRPPVDWCMGYDAKHLWNGMDAVGASLSALARLGAILGYRLVGCNLTGANAFFVRKDLAGDLFAEPPTPANLFQPPRYGLIYAYRGGHGVSSLSVIQGAFGARGLPIPDATQFGATVKPLLPDPS